MRKWFQKEKKVKIEIRCAKGDPRPCSKYPSAVACVGCEFIPLR